MNAALLYTNHYKLYGRGQTIFANSLGPTDSIRFIRLLYPSSCDYTATRQSQLNKGTEAELCNEIRNSERSSSNP
jgi:hypothetical protein